MNNRCWTDARLAKRGLPYLAACPLCDQAEESIQPLPDRYGTESSKIGIEFHCASLYHQILKLVVPGNQRSAEGDQRRPQFSYH